MQQVSYKIKAIFKEHWKPFKKKYPHLVSPYTDRVVSRSLACRTEVLGCRVISCSDCDSFRIIPFSCKSRFCSSCGAAYNDSWVNKIEEMIWPVPHHHLTFSIPASLQPLLSANLILINALFTSAKQALAAYAKDHKVFIPAFATLQTYGSRLNYNAHLHIAVPAYVLSSDLKKLKSDFYYEIHAISKKFTALFVRKIRAAYKNNLLLSPPELRFNSCSQFNAYLDKLVSWCFKPNNPKSWCVYISKRKEFEPLPISYIARYVKTPPISEARVKYWNKKNVTFYVKDYTFHPEDFDAIPTGKRRTIRVLKKLRKKKMVPYKLPLYSFMASLIQHIPPKNFRVVRFFGPYSNRSRRAFLNKVSHLFPKPPIPAKQKEFPSSWRERRIKETGKDPMICPACGKQLKAFESLYPRDLILKNYTFKQLSKMTFSEYLGLRKRIVEENAKASFDTS